MTIKREIIFIKQYLDMLSESGLKSIAKLLTNSGPKTSVIFFRESTLSSET